MLRVPKVCLASPVNPKGNRELSTTTLPPSAFITLWPSAADEPPLKSTVTLPRLPSIFMARKKANAMTSCPLASGWKPSPPQTW